MGKRDMVVIYKEGKMRIDREGRQRKKKMPE